MPSSSAIARLIAEAGAGCKWSVCMYKNRYTNLQSKQGFPIPANHALRKLMSAMQMPGFEARCSSWPSRERFNQRDWSSPKLRLPDGGRSDQPGATSRSSSAPCGTHPLSSARRA